MNRPYLHQGIPVSEHIVGPLCRLARGWAPQPPPFAPIKQLFIGDVDMSHLAEQLTIEKDRLCVKLTASSWSDRDLLSLGRQHKPFHGHLTDGALFHAQFNGQTLGASSEIRGSGWSVVLPSPSSVWVGRVNGPIEQSTSGNMGIAGSSFVSGGHYRLVGIYDYYLVRSKIDNSVVWHLVVDTGGKGIPQTEALWGDVSAIEFVLGCQLRVPVLLGLQADCRIVDCIEGWIRWRHGGEILRSPVPTHGTARASWAPLFFEKLSKALSHPTTDRRLQSAIMMYVDAMTNTLDLDYLRLHVGLEALSYWILHTNEKTEIVKDKETWKAWVEQHRGEIHAHAKSGFENSLYGKVVGAYRLASGRVVPNAFKLLGVDLTPEMRNELEARDVVVHQGLMAPEGYELERDVRRIRLVRSMLIALIALDVGYRGAIVGWELDKMRYPVEPPTEWWQVDEEDRKKASQKYTAYSETPINLR